MAGPTVGRAEIAVDFDGRNLVGQAKALAAQAGGDAGTYFSKEFGKNLTGLGKQFGDVMKKHGDAAGISFTKAFQNSIRRHIDGVTHEIAEAFRTPEGLEAFITSLGGVEEGAERTRAKLAEMSAAGAANNAEFDRLTATLEETVANMRTTAEQTERQKQADEEHYQVLLKKIIAQKAEVEQLDRLGAQLQENFAAGNRFQQIWRGATTTLNDNTTAIAANDNAHKSWWKSLSRNTRQWTLIIGAIAAGGESIATLGSALGPGILTLGAAITQTGIGAGVMIAAFRGLNGEIDDLPAAVRPAATAFQRLGDAFGALQDEIQIAALENAAGAFESIQATVEALTPAFQTVAKAVGRVIDQFAKGIAPGTKNFQNLNKIIEDSGDVFEDVMRILGKFGEALGNVFASPVMQQSVQDLLGWIEGLADAFKAFTEGPGLTTWFNRASAIFGAIGRLLEATGSALAGLVDDAAVARFVAMLDNLSGFMPTLEGLLSALGELDLFGLIAQALNDFGDAIEPLLGPLEDLFGAVNDIASIAIGEWAETLGGIAEAVAPAVQLLADAVGDLDPVLVASMADAFLAFAAASLILKGASGIAGLATKIKGLGGALKALNLAVPILGIILWVLSDLMTNFPEWEKNFTAIDKWGDKFFNEQLGTAIADFFSGIDEAGDQFFNNDLPAWFANIGTTIGTGFANAFNSIISFFVTVGTAISDWWVGLWTTITTYLGTAFATLGEGIVTGFANIGIFFAGIGAAITAWWVGLWDGIVAWVGQAWANITAAVATGWNTAWSVLVAVGAAIAAWWTGFWDGIAAWVGQAWANISAAVTNGWNAVWNVIVAVGAAIAGWWGGFWGGLSTWVGQAWAVISAVVSNGWNAIANFFRSMGATIASVWSSIWSGLGSVLAGVWAGIISTVSGAVNTVIGIINRITGAINGVLGAIKNITGGLINLKIPSLPGMAAGGITSGPTLAGEGGEPEIIIPMRRPLSTINPSVRGYAAALRGEDGAGGGGPQKVVTVMPGAIVIQESRQPVNTAAAALDRLVAKI